MLTRDANYAAADGCSVAHTVDEALADAAADGATTLMVIGGEAVYQAFLPRAVRVHLTRVHTRVDGGDARFPDLQAEQ